MVRILMGRLNNGQFIFSEIFYASPFYPQLDCTACTIIENQNILCDEICDNKIKRKYNRY